MFGQSRIHKSFRERKLRRWGCEIRSSFLDCSFYGIHTSLETEINLTCHDLKSLGVFLGGGVDQLGKPITFFLPTHICVSTRIRHDTKYRLCYHFSAQSAIHKLSHATHQRRIRNHQPCRTTTLQSSSRSLSSSSPSPLLPTMRARGSRLLQPHLYRPRLLGRLRAKCKITRYASFCPVYNIKTSSQNSSLATQTETCKSTSSQRYGFVCHTSSQICPPTTRM